MKGDVFSALGDPRRRELLDRLNTRNGQTLHELCEGMAMTRQAVTRHLQVLEEANLISTFRQGRETLHYLNPVPVQEIAQRWISEFSRPHLAILSQLKRTLEEPVTRPDFVYTTYIRTTREVLWQHLTDPDFIPLWWRGMNLRTDWKPGSTIDWENNGHLITDADQVVVEVDPFRRLVYTWHTFIPELNDELVHLPQDRWDRLVREPRSQVTFELEDVEGRVKLTVVQGKFDPDSETLRMVSRGWPIFLSNLKTLLETGSA